MATLTITRPDDCHLHLRDGVAMEAVLPFSAERFGRALIMPNLKPPVTTVEDALLYRERILDALPEGSSFMPLMTLYLTDKTSPSEIDRATKSGIVKAMKYYHAGATTNSDSGVTDLRKLFPVLKVMEECDLVLSLHGETSDPLVDVFDREKWFIDGTLLRLLDMFPQLHIVLEHITTAHAVRVVSKHGENLAATITAHHLLANRNDMLANGINPHLYCKPILKRKTDQYALIEAATSGNPKFFLGTDSAPHARHTKESACGCAGCFTAHSGIELYAEVFESADALDKLEGFASHFGADFYGIPRNTDTITLENESWTVPKEYPFGGENVLVPFRAGEMVQWKLKK